jgi:ribonucleoside-triphosphate reductase
VLKTDLIQDYLSLRDWRIKENANIGFSVQGLNLRIIREASAEFWFEIFGREAKQLHEERLLYIHQLSQLTPYCVGWDLADLLVQGFQTPILKSKPPKHLRTALLQLCNFLYSTQGEAAGAVAVSNFDSLLAPFLRNEPIPDSELDQIMQEFLFNMNVPTRVGMQTPFTNITFDLVPPPSMARQTAIAPQGCDFTYGELVDEMRRIASSFFRVASQGDAAGRVFTFPIPTVDVGPDFPWEDERLDPLWEATAKYGMPYFANYLTSGRSREDSRSMCCRLRLDVSKIHERKGVFSALPLTGSIGVITLNLPGIALRSHSFGDFLKGVACLVREAIRILNKKREFIEEMTERGLYPQSKIWLSGVKERTGKYWSQHFSTIGVIGMHEALQNLGYEDGIVSKEGVTLALEVLGLINSILDAEEGLWNLEAVPAEGASYELASYDVERFGRRAHHQGDKEAPFYTNSTQLPPGATDDLFFALEHQAPLQAAYTGGTIFHIWLGEGVPDPLALKRLIRRIFEMFPIPYITFTPTFSICPAHGYIPGKHETCPWCGRFTEIYSRPVGYLRPVHSWHKGKQAEFRLRKTYTVSMGG